MRFKSLILALTVFLMASTASAQTVELDPGWNLISPIQGTLTDSQIMDRCGLSDSPDGPWTMDSPPPWNWGESPTNVMQPNKGYWLKMPSSCSIRMDAEPVVNEIELDPGWNLISPIQGTLTDSQIMDRCGLSDSPDGPWTMDSPPPWNWGESPTNVMQPNKGYWLKMPSSCNMNFEYDSGKGSGGPDKPQELSDEGEEFTWSYVERTQQCSGFSGFRQGDEFRGTGNWYYCGQNSNHLWVSDQTCQDFPSSSEEIRCASSEVFELRKSGDRYEVEPENGYSFTGIDSNFNGIDSETGRFTSPVSSGEVFRFQLRGPNGETERVKLQAPSANLQVSKQLYSMGESLNIEATDISGGSSEDYTSVQNIEWSLPDDYTTSGTDLASNVYVNSLNALTGVYRIEATLTDSTPGGLSATESNRVYVADGFLEDYRKDVFFEDNAEKVADQWQILDHGEPRDEQEWWFKEDNDRSLAGYRDIRTPWIDDDTFGPGSAKGTEVLRITTNRVYDDLEQGSEHVDYDVAVKRDIDSFGQMVTRLRTESDGSSAEAYVQFWNDGRVVFEQRIESSDGYDNFFFNHEEGSITVERSDSLFGAREEIGSASVADVTGFGFEVKGEVDSTQTRDLFVDYIAVNSGTGGETDTGNGFDGGRRQDPATLN